MAEDIGVFTGAEHQPFELGSGEAGAALLIHGFPGTPAEVRPLGTWLAGLGWFVQGILLPGFGTDIPNLKDRSRCDWVAAAEDAWQALADRGGPRTAIGYSMGAAVAMHLDFQPADRLVLAAPFWRFGGLLPRLVPIIQRFKPELAPFKKANFSDPRLREQLGRILPDADLDDPQVQQAVRERFVLPMRAADELIRIGSEAYHRAEMLACDCLILQGSNDTLVRPDASRKLAGRLRRGKTIYQEVDAGHDLLASAHLEVYRAIENFLETGEV
jgi:carboxylesterase